VELIISKQDALEKLNVHLERHITEYKEQFRGWQQAMQIYGDTLKAYAAGSAEGKRPDEPVRPVNHIKQYKELINKLEHHVPETILVDDYEFDQIINDKFGWTGGFLLSNTTYAAAALTEDRIDAGTITRGDHEEL
jgi:hypothetical protein